ncbi:MAG: hypothetical protein DWQ49_11000 [Bacteroidetes bacterium]|nr:MAG: hypothetical protein DWQ49_11000 [Bacteroidota bacterium]
MGGLYKEVYSAAQNCINTSFCLDGGSFDSSNISLPRSLKIRIVANPDFWGFGTLADNTLIEGWGTFNEGYFDFFDGHDPDHTQLKVCGGTDYGIFNNEQRPDVSYRSVYDPENGDKHYANGGEDGIVRGGAESYLLDRGGNTTDGSSCSTTAPDTVFKTNPAGYGIAPKILFDNNIYKNITGAWRINECSGCYTQHDGGNDLRNLDCSGAPKQHIQGDENFAKLYDPFRNRCISNKYYNSYVGESGCNSDGEIAGQYAGTISSIVRDTGISPFLKYTFQYDGGAASGIFNGNSIGITATSGDGGALTFFDVQHSGGSTTAYAVGSQGSVNVNNSDSGQWTLFHSYDPNTCCGGAAYGVDPELMNLTNSPVYHIDIGRVFNNPKNKIYSNRIDRTYNGLTVEPEVPKGTLHTNKKYIAVNEDGNALLVHSGALYEVDLACQTEVWSATAEYIYELDGQYSTASGDGAIPLSTDSGFYPLKAATLPYYGPLDVTDRFDYAERSNEYGNRQKDRNATCYTKQGSLSVYPDCLTQHTQYIDCTPKTNFTINNVPRIALVYRGCDFNDPCSFDDSGRPWTAGASGHPSNMNDLIRGFGGQEIQMYVNLGTARGAEIKRDPCDCEGGKPGTAPPLFVEVPSPVTYPCFPKFDLYPEDYGCEDPLYYAHIMSRLGLETNPSGICGTPYYDACDPIQPYTTYGYIRNLCGKETNSRRGVIDSLSEKLHTGDYDDLNHTDNTVEPMYVSFEQDVPDCCSPTGFPAGGPDCEGSYDFTSYGEGATADLVVDSTGGISFNINTAGSGYIFGGGVYEIPTTTLSPEQTFSLTFGTAETGLSAITSTPGTGLPFNTTIALTIVPGVSGIAGTGGFSFDDCGSINRAHYWGLTDTQGRLALPYFRTQPDETSLCNSRFSYVNYSDTGTIVNNWPKDKVPFLVEIDHEEYCSSCETTQMPTGNLVLSVESLTPEFAHAQVSQTNEGSYIYGWNHCKYPGAAITPQYDSCNDSWDPDFCESGDGLALTYGQPQTGSTCDCADDFSVLMVPRVLEGTNAPIGYVTSGSVDVQGNINSYVQFGDCKLSNWINDGNYMRDIIGGGCDKDTFYLMQDHTVFMKASLSCADAYADIWTIDSIYFGSFDGLEQIYGCSVDSNERCATSFPAPNSAPSLDLDFYYVNSNLIDIFTGLSDVLINTNEDFLVNGLDFTLINSNYPWRNTGTFTCGSTTAEVSSIVFATGNNCCHEIVSTAPSGREDYLQHTHCINGNKGKYEANINLSPCLGARIVMYSPSLFHQGVYNRYRSFSSPKFSDGGGNPSASWVHRSRFPTEEEFNHPVNSDHNGCQTPSVPEYMPSGSGQIYSTDLGCCFYDSLGLFIPAISGALVAWSGGSAKEFADLQNSNCLTTDRDPTRCCWNYRKTPPEYVATNCYNEEHINTNTTPLGCNRRDLGNQDILFDVTYSVLTNPITSVKTTGWYGDIEFPINTTLAMPIPEFLYWSGSNLPGLGDVGPLAYGVPVAYRYDSSEVREGNTNLGGYNSIEVEHACAYHTGPNRYAYIGAELNEPVRSTQQNNLVPESCEPMGCGPAYSSCGTPVPFDTYAGGIGTGIRVNKKSCWPEVMTVHKIECEGSRYKLHVSREYFEHDRTWYTIAPDSVVVPRLGLIQGSGTSARYSCEETYPTTCADPGTGGSPTNLDASFALKMMTPSDSISPVYPDVCATGTEPYSKTDTSYGTYRFGAHSTSEEHPSGCLYYPGVSGQQFWNFYNLLYDSGSPSSIYLSDAGGGVYELPPDPDLSCNEAFPHNLIEISGDLNPVFTSESELKHAHSFIQDFLECGGDLWCNKEFFPRRSYKKNTRITKFAALSICEQNAELQKPIWYEGHETTWDSSPNKAVLATGPFVNACDDDAAVLLDEDVGIDDNIIYIPLQNSASTAPSIDTLMGVIHPGFKSNLNEKTCIYADPGECLGHYPEHNDGTIRDITFAPDEYGYYLDDLVTSGVDNCLFTPFKILVDVECCPDRIGHKGTNDPTNLNYIAKIPAGSCNGWVTDPPCDCFDTDCPLNQNTFEGPLLKGLECAAGIELHGPYISGGLCALECPSETGNLPPDSGYIFYLSEEPGGGWVVDPTGGAPGDLLTPVVTPLQLYITEQACDSGTICEIYGTGEDDFYDPVWSGHWVSTGDPSHDNIASTGLTLFEYNGEYWDCHGHYNEETGEFENDWQDIIDYSGQKYRFAGGGFGLDTNCCGQQGASYGAGKTSEPGDANIGKRLLIDQHEDYGGCDCTWSVCDLLDSGVGQGVILFPSEAGGIYSIDEVSGSGNGTPVGTKNEVLEHFGCKDVANTRECFYPSIVKFNITESI